MDSDDLYMPDYVTTVVSPLLRKGGANALLSASCNKTEMSVTKDGDIHFECHNNCEAGDGGVNYNMVAGLFT